MQCPLGKISIDTNNLDNCPTRQCVQNPNCPSPVCNCNKNEVRKDSVDEANCPICSCAAPDPRECPPAPIIDCAKGFYANNSTIIVDRKKCIVAGCRKCSTPVCNCAKWQIKIDGIDVNNCETCSCQPIL